jgi:hypothetical protein
VPHHEHSCRGEDTEATSLLTAKVDMILTGHAQRWRIAMASNLLAVRVSTFVNWLVLGEASV